MVTDENTYYFSISCTATTRNSDGTYSADRDRMEFLFHGDSDELGKLKGTTSGGLFKVNTDVERLYTEHFDMINRL